MRTLAPFLRASRQTLRPGASASSLFTAGRQQAVTSAFVRYATSFERSKPHVNIGTIGHVDHGKVRFLRVCICSLLPRPWALNISSTSRNEALQGS